MAYIVVAIVAYLLGSISFSVLISKKLAGFDVRKKGSGNAGATNVLRSVGKKAAIITLICDVLKGVIAVLFAYIIGNIFAGLNNSMLIKLAGIFVIIGHTYPVFFEFKGGKGIATALGVLLITNWNIGLVCLFFALIVMAFTRIVSLGSLAAAALFPLLVIFMTGDNFLVQGNYVLFAFVLSIIVIFNHRGNIRRLIMGNENKLYFEKEK